MQGYCAKCLQPMGEERYCPNCGYDRLQNLENNLGQEGANVYTQPKWEETPREESKTGPQPVTQSKRVRKLPILLAAVVVLGAMLLLKEKDPEKTVKPVEYTMPQFEKPKATVPKATEPEIREPESTHPEVTEASDGWLIFSYTAPDVVVTMDSNNVLTVTVKELTLKDSYRVNLPDSKKWDVEYGWFVNMYQDDRVMSTLMVHSKPSDEEPAATIRLEDMRPMLYLDKGASDPSGAMYAIHDVKVGLSYDDSSITWQCIVPREDPWNEGEPFPIDIREVDRITVTVKDKREKIIDKEHTFNK